MTLVQVALRLLVPLLAWVLLAAPIPVTGAERVTEAVRIANGKAVSHGAQLERSRRWLDAIEHYETSLEVWPDSDELKYGLRRSRIHFGIERRYADESFDRKLLPKSRFEALVLFDEVLSHVRKHFVDSLGTTSFVAHGTESLYLALGNPKFRGKHLPKADQRRIDRMRRILRSEYWNKPVAHREEARRVVQEVCDLGERSLGLPAGAVVMEYVFGGCNALDDYSGCLTPDRLDDLYGNIEGEFVGLGIEMKSELERGLLLVDVLPDSPAERGGLLPGDHIVAINGRDCRSMTTDEAARLLRGPSGSHVRLRVASTGKTPRTTVVERRAVHVKSIPVAEIVDRTNGIGYIRMTGFQKTTADELDAALRKLDARGMRALVWDLRGNPGGLLTAAVEVLDRFIDDGILVSTRGRTEDQNWKYSARRIGTWNVPLVLLVDGDSASASEIVAGAVRDHRRGTIVGRKTYGKWSVQSIFPLRNSTGLRLTTAKFYSPHGHTYGKIGVEPHVSVATPDGKPIRPTGRRVPGVKTDPDLRRSRELLLETLARR